MGKVGRFLIGGALIGAGFIFGGPTGVAAVLKSVFLGAGASLAANALLAPSLRISQRQGAVLQNTADTQGPLPVAYGRVKLGLRMVDMRTSGPNNELLWIVGALCHGSEDGTGIEGIDEIYFNDRLAVAADGTVQPEFLGKLDFAKMLGSDSQSYATASIGGSSLDATFAEWTTACAGKGVAGLVLGLTFDAEIYATGIPTITAIVRGNKVKDPANLAAAAAYSTNPARCLYDYLASTRYGAACAASELNATSFATMASYYDTVVTKDTTLTTTGPLFSCNGWLDVSQPTTENLRQLLTSCRGVLVYEGGQHRLLTRRAVTPASFALSEANLVGDWTFHLPGIGDAPNLMRGTYVEPGPSTESYPFQPATRYWPRPGTTNGYLTADNGYEVTQDADLPFTADAYTAEQILLVTLKELRSGITVGVTATEAALALQVGDVVPVTHPTPGWSSKHFWVMGIYLLPESKLVRLALLEYDSTAYTLDALSTVPAPPSTLLPNPFTVQPPGELVLIAGDDQAQPDRDGSHAIYIRATWTAAPEPYLDYYEVEYRLSGTEVWGPSPDPRRTALESLIGPLSEGASYDVRVRAVNTLGRVSAWMNDTIVPHFTTLQRSGSFWIDDFSSQTPGRRWASVGTTDTGTFVDVYDPDALVGGKCGRATGPVAKMLADAIPFDPNLLYSIRFRVRQLRDPAVGAKEFSIGLIGLAQVPGQPGVYTYVNTFGFDAVDNQHWILATKQSLPAGRGWTDLFAHFKGYAGGKVPLTAAMLSQSGLGSFTAANLVDGDTTPTKVGFSVDAATAGAYIKFDLGVARSITEARLHMAAGGSVAAWDLEFSDDGVNWTTASG